MQITNRAVGEAQVRFGWVTCHSEIEKLQKLAYLLSYIASKSKVLLLNVWRKISLWLSNEVLIAVNLFSLIFRSSGRWAALFGSDDWDEIFSVFLPSWEYSQNVFVTAQKTCGLVKQITSQWNSKGLLFCSLSDICFYALKSIAHSLTCSHSCF